MLYSENYVQDLIDSGEFQEEAEKGIDVPFYELESIRVTTIYPCFKMTIFWFLL